MLRLRCFPYSVLLAIVSFGSLARLGWSEDWPQWMGATRDNRWDADDILQRFPSEGPTVVWRREVAGGYAGPAVVGDRVYVTDFVTAGNVKVSNFDRAESEGTERVLCLNAVNGEVVWKYEYPVTYTISYPAGPRCTPLVEENRVYALGAEGNLLCLDRATGDLLWQRDFKQEYNTKSALWGYASHPLIDGDKLICIAGGAGSHAVALNKLTGAEIWRYGTAPEQGYSPPTIIQAGGTRQLILMSPASVASVDPETGKEYWRQAYEATSGSVIMTPVSVDNYLYVGGYSNRSLMLELNADRPGATVLFRDKSKTGISPVNVQPFLEGNVMYGMDGGGALMAVEIPSGKRLWQTGQPLGERPVQTGTAFIVKNGDRFFLFAETGELIIARLSRDGYTEIDRTQVIEPTNNAFGRPVVWCAPAFANGRMYVRNDEECLCVELTASRSP